MKQMGGIHLMKRSNILAHFIQMKTMSIYTFIYRWMDQQISFRKWAHWGRRTGILCQGIIFVKRVIHCAKRYVGYPSPETNWSILIHSRMSSSKMFLVAANLRVRYNLVSEEAAKLIHVRLVEFSDGLFTRRIHHHALTTV